MKLSDLSDGDIRQALHRGLTLRIEPFSVYLQTDIHQIIPELKRNYGTRDIQLSEGFADFKVSLKRPRTFRRWLQPQVEFYQDFFSPFKPLPFNQAYPMFEWGLNWCVASQSHQYVLLHAAVLAKGDHAVILPAPPGSGKSTLCAALSTRGWRLFSDELTLIDPTTGEVVPLPRPVNLKNNSIDVMRRYAPDASFGPRFNDTHKGDVCYMRPTEQAIDDALVRAKPAWVILPKYKPDADLTLTPMGRPQALAALAENAFNYEQLGADSFDTLAQVVDGCACYSLEYSRLDEAIQAFADLSLARLESAV